MESREPLPTSGQLHVTTMAYSVLIQTSRFHLVVSLRITLNFGGAPVSPMQFVALQRPKGGGRAAYLIAVIERPITLSDGAVASCVGIADDASGSVKMIVSGGAVNRCLRGECLAEALPSIDLAHGDLA